MGDKTIALAVHPGTESAVFESVSSFGEMFKDTSVAPTFCDAFVTFLNSLRFGWNETKRSAGCGVKVHSQKNFRIITNLV